MAIETADVVLMRSDPLDVDDAPDTPGDGTRGPIVELMRKVAFAGRSIGWRRAACCGVSVA